MKIIKPGIPKKDRVFRHICHECECEFEFTEKEARHESCRRERDSWWVVKCPQKGCGVENILRDLRP